MRLILWQPWRTTRTPLVWILHAAYAWIVVHLLLRGLSAFGLADRLQRRLLPFGRRSEVLILLLYAVLENLGYRQLTLYWRLRGLWDAWRGKTGWEKFGSVGFRPGEAPAHG